MPKTHAAISAIFAIAVVLGGWPSAAAGMEWPPKRLHVGELRVSQPGGFTHQLRNLRVSQRDDDVSLSIERMESFDAAGRPLHVPLWAGGRWSAGGAARGLLADAAERLRMTLNYAPAAGTVTLSTGSVQFDEDLTPATLFPPLSGLASKVDGRVALSAMMHVATGRQEIDLDIAGLGFAIGDLFVEGLDASIDLQSAQPLVTQGTNSFGVESIRLGEHRAFVRGTFSADGDQLRLGDFHLTTRQGRLRLVETHLDLATNDALGRLVIDQFDLQRLIELAGVEGLEAEGAVGGVVPFSAQLPRVVTLNDGRLSALAPGVLRYRPAVFPAALAGNDPSLLLVRQALENFHFTALQVTLHGSSDSDMSVLVELDGANPELYGGQPLEFNLQFDGALGVVAGQALRVYGLPDRLAKLLLDWLD